MGSASAKDVPPSTLLGVPVGAGSVHSLLIRPGGRPLVLATGGSSTITISVSTGVVPPIDGAALHQHEQVAVDAGRVLGAEARGSTTRAIPKSMSPPVAPSYQFSDPQEDVAEEPAGNVASSTSSDQSDVFPATPKWMELPGICRSTRYQFSLPARPRVSMYCPALTGTALVSVSPPSIRSPVTWNGRSAREESRSSARTRSSALSAS